MNFISHLECDDLEGARGLEVDDYTALGPVPRSHAGSGTSPEPSKGQASQDPGSSA